MKARHTRPRYRRMGAGLSPEQIDAWYRQVNAIRGRKRQRGKM